MRDHHRAAPFRVGSLTQLDELVGQYVADQKPAVHWEDARTHFRFETIEEAEDAMQDPFLREFLIPKDRTKPVLTPVQEFPAYSQQLDAAWDLVTRFDEPLHVRHRQKEWVAAFGRKPSVAAQTPAVAICLAALRARGIEVRIADNLPRDPAG